VGVGFRDAASSQFTILVVVAPAVGGALLVVGPAAVVGYHELALLVVPDDLLTRVVAVSHGTLLLSSPLVLAASPSLLQR